MIPEGSRSLRRLSRKKSAVPAFENAALRFIRSDGATCRPNLFAIYEMSSNLHFLTYNVRSVPRNASVASANFRFLIIDQPAGRRWAELVGQENCFLSAAVWGES